MSSQANYDDQIKELQQERMDLQKQVGEVLRDRANLRATENITQEPTNAKLKAYDKDLSNLNLRVYTYSQLLSPH